MYQAINKHLRASTFRETKITYLHGMGTRQSLMILKAGRIDLGAMFDSKVSEFKWLVTTRKINRPLFNIKSHVRTTAVVLEIYNGPEVLDDLLFEEMSLSNTHKWYSVDCYIHIVLLVFKLTYPKNIKHFSLSVTYQSIRYNDTHVFENGVFSKYHQTFMNVKPRLHEIRNQFTISVRQVTESTIIFFVRCIEPHFLFSNDDDV